MGRLEALSRRPEALEARTPEACRTVAGGKRRRRATTGSGDHHVAPRQGCRTVRDPCRGRTSMRMLTGGGAPRGAYHRLPYGTPSACSATRDRSRSFADHPSVAAWRVRGRALGGRRVRDILTAEASRRSGVFVTVEVVAPGRRGPGVVRLSESSPSHPPHVSRWVPRGPPGDMGKGGNWSGQEDLNLRPHGPEPCALTRLSYAPRCLRREGVHGKRRGF